MGRAGRAGLSRRRKLCFAALAVALAWLPVDLLLRWVLPDPRATAVADRELVVALSYDPRARIVADGADGTRGFARGIDGELADLYHPDRWQVPTPDGTYRLAIVGDSTVFGTFTSILAAGLEVPGRQVELLNFGSCGMASDRVRLSARAALEQDLDLLLVYVGHNEVAEARRDPGSRVPMWRRTIRSELVFSGVGRALRLPVRAALDARPPPPPPPAEHVWHEAMYHPLDDPEWREVSRSYRRNLSAICRRARRAGVPVALIEPASSLLSTDDVVPAASLVDPALLAIREARAWARDGRADEALQRADELARRFPDSGEPLLLQGTALLALDRRDEAIDALREARRREINPDRADERHFAVLREVGEAHGVPVIATEPALLADPRYLRLDDPLFVDNMHPSNEGSAVLAGAVVAGLAGTLPAGSRYDADRVPLDDFPSAQPHGWRPASPERPAHRAPPR